MTSEQGALTAQSVRQIIEGEGIKTVRVTFVDNSGVTRARNVTAATFATHGLEDGIQYPSAMLSVDTSATFVVPAGSGFASGYPSWVLKPDPATFVVLPWAPGTAKVVADVYTLDGDAVEIAPRSVLKRVLVNPLVNSYKRLRPYTFAPSNVSWGLENRMTLLRVPYARGKGTRLENRLPGADNNPYLMMAAVTGGSKGLGRAIALELAREGAEVALCARDGGEVEAAAREIGADVGREVLGVVADVTRVDDIQRLVEATVARFGGLDILVNNAGRATPGDFETLTDEAWQADLDVKLFSQIRCARAALPHLRARGRAHRQHQRGLRPDARPRVLRDQHEPRVLPRLQQGAGDATRAGEHPGQRRQHRLRGHAAVGQHLAASRPRHRPRGVPGAVGAAGRADGALRRARGSIGPRRLPVLAPGLLHHRPLRRCGWRHGQICVKTQCPCA